jgi:ABC-type antimicrobial peptide transport system permease subunit
VAGAVLSQFAAASVTSLLFGLKATGLRSLLGAAGLLALVALAASYVPARRAANLDPNTALRGE